MGMVARLRNIETMTRGLRTVMRDMLMVSSELRSVIDTVETKKKKVKVKKWLNSEHDV